MQESPKFRKAGQFGVPRPNEFRGLSEPEVLTTIDSGLLLTNLTCHCAPGQAWERRSKIAETFQRYPAGPSPGTNLDLLHNTSGSSAGEACYWTCSGREGAAKRRFHRAHRPHDCRIARPKTHHCHHGARNLGATWKNKQSVRRRPEASDRPGWDPPGQVGRGQDRVVRGRERCHAGRLRSRPASSFRRIDYRSQRPLRKPS